MAADIEKARPDVAIELHGEEDKPGTFDVVVEGKQLWSKHETGSFPEGPEVIAMIPAKKDEPPSS